MTTDPRVRLQFESKIPHTTYWIAVEAPSDSEPFDLYNALESAGWIDQHGDVPGYMGLDGYDIVERAFVRPGSGLFNGWTEDEHKRFVLEARGIMARFGFTRVPHVRLSRADLG